MTVKYLPLHVRRVLKLHQVISVDSDPSAVAEPEAWRAQPTIRPKGLSRHSPPLLSRAGLRCGNGRQCTIFLATSIATRSYNGLRRVGLISIGSNLPFSVYFESIIKAVASALKK